MRRRRSFAPLRRSPAANPRSVRAGLPGVYNPPVRAALFVTCLTDTFFPRAGEAVVRVLRHFGCAVEFPPAQTCCGQPAYNSGFHRAARDVAAHWVEVFDPYECVVTPSASCAAMISRHTPELLADDPALKRAAERLAERTYEFSVFLRDRLLVDTAALLRIAEPFTVHYPCHARGVYSVGELCASLPGEGPNGLRLPRHTDLCCGFGGMFAIDQPQISGAMAGDKLDELAATRAELVVCNEAGCTLNLMGSANRRGMCLRFRHVAELLAESLGLLEPAP